MVVLASDVPAAWIAAAGSLAVAIMGAVIAVWSAIRSERLSLQVEALRTSREDRIRREDREIAARQQLDRYRQPLRDAARDLRDRIDNISREDSVHFYLNHGDAAVRDLTLKATLYRFASYWGVVEALYRDVSRLNFENDLSTKTVNSLLANIGKKFATDSLGPELMVWREEQRGIGEVMHAPIEPGELVRVIGFSTFVKRYEQDLAPWLARFAAQIQLPQTWRHARLVEVRSLLADLDRELAAE